MPKPKARACNSLCVEHARARVPCPRVSVDMLVRCPRSMARVPCPRASVDMLVRCPRSMARVPCPRASVDMYTRCAVKMDGCHCCASHASRKCGMPKPKARACNSLGAEHARAALGHATHGEYRLWPRKSTRLTLDLLRQIKSHSIDQVPVEEAPMLQALDPVIPFYVSSTI
jgi:hypothetical protein